MSKERDARLRRKALDASLVAVFGAALTLTCVRFSMEEVNSRSDVAFAAVYVTVPLAVLFFVLTVVIVVRIVVRKEEKS